MSYSASALKSEVAGMIHGTSLSKVENINGAIYRAARQVLQDVDPIETMRIVPLAAPVSQNVWDYPAPADLKGDCVADIRPTGDRTAYGKYNQSYSESFDVTKNYGTLLNPFTIVWKNGNKLIRISTDLGNSPVTLDALTSSTNWAGTLTSIATDTVTFIADKASVSAVLPPATGMGYIQKTLSTALDLTANYNLASQYVNVFFETASYITSVSIAWGTDSSNYYEYTATTTAEGTTFQNGWNLIKAPWVSATVTGTPTISSIAFLRLTVNYTTGGQVVRFNLLQSAMGQTHDLVYYSKYLFRNSTTGAFQETITSADNSELINLDTDSYNLLVYQTAIQVVQQSRPLNDTNDLEWLENKYMQTLARYTAKIKSQAKRTTTSYYTISTNSPRPWRFF